MIKLIRWAMPAALVGVASLASADTRTWFGPEVGVYLPTSGKLRDALGSQWFSFGAGSVNTDRATGRKTAFDYATVSQNKNGSKVFLGAVSYGYTIPLGNTGPEIGLVGERSSIQPYVAFRGGASYIDYAVNTGGTRESGKRLGFNANAELGVLIGDRLKVSARYDVFPSYDGLSFSGFSLSARYGLFRF